MLKTTQIQKPRYVLIVDDQEINRDILGAILEDDYQLLFAADGKEAMELLRIHTDIISLVMLDLMMPVMNGFEVLEAMHSDEVLQEIPVIVLTADKNAELKALQLGAADFITKPFDLHEVILARVERIVELSEGKNLISAAEHDKITALYNRSFFWEYANSLYAYHTEIHFDALVLNIEQFHSINAVHGREFGDKVLAALGQEVQAFLQQVKGIGGRFEADHFYIYCEACEDYAKVLARFQAAMEEKFKDVNVRLRMGVMRRQENMEPLSLFDHANTACNKVSGNYAQPLMIFNEEMRRREILDRKLLNDLNAAIEENQLKVYYQPKYDIQCNPPRLSSAEALIRWIHPELGFISPGEFIPLFESNGMIRLVDRFVWENAAKQIVAWRKKYGITIPVSVNVSRSDIFDFTLVDRLEALIRDNDIRHGDLKLEITESAYAEDVQKMIDLITRLEEMGFEIEMDDFGSGYSSLNMLSSMPVDVLKMDMQFIRNIESNETDRKLVTLVLEIAKHLKLTVVAEGVENEKQLHILQNAGCNLVQGFYFSRPLPPEAFEALIRREIETKRD